MYNEEEKQYDLVVPESGVTVLSLNNEINLFGRCTIVRTTEVITYPPIDDDPVQLEKDNGWIGNLSCGVLASVALAGIAVGIAVTGGAAGIEASLLLGETTTFTAATVPQLATAAGYTAIAAAGASALNQTYELGSGTNLLLGLSLKTDR